MYPFPQQVIRLISDSYSADDIVYETDGGIEKLLLLGLSYDHPEIVQKRTHWMYLTNPAGRAIVVLLRFKESNEAIGLVAICRRQVWTHAGIADTGIFCDLVIDKAHRTLGPALFLMQHAIGAADSKAIDKVDGWPSERSQALFKRLPKAEMGSVDIYRRYLNWRTIFEERLPPVPARLVGTLCQIVDKGQDMVKRLTDRHLYTVRHPETFDKAFDELWKVARVRYEEIGVRDSEFLNWRFMASPADEHKVFALFSRCGSRALGYVVYREIEDKTMEICDFLAYKGGHTERYLLNSFCMFVKRSGFRKMSLMFSGSVQSRRSITFCGFIRVSSRLASCRQSASSRLSNNSHAGFTTRADQDVG